MDVSSGDDGGSLLTLVNPKSTNTGTYSCFAVRMARDYMDETGFETAYVEVNGECFKALKGGL